MDFDAKLDDLFIDLPEPSQIPGFAAHAVRSGKSLYVSGILPRAEGGKIMTGRVGVDVRLDYAKAAARAALIAALGVIFQELNGTLNGIKKIVQVDLDVACGADFKDHFKVLDSASELINQIFGSAGNHTRRVTGAISLPEGASVELSMVVEVK